MPQKQNQIGENNEECLGPKNSSLEISKSNSNTESKTSCEHTVHGIHSHTHIHSGGHIVTAFWVNFFFAAVAFAGGLFAKSSALLAEAVHGLGDTLSVGVAWVLEKFSHRKGDTIFTYGYRRFSLLASIIISLLLISISIMMLISGIGHIFGQHLHIGHDHGHFDPNAKGMLVVAIVGLLAKAYAAFRLSKGHSFNERAVMFHMLMDTLSWGVILLTSLIMIFVKIPVLDNILSICIALWILYNMVPNLLGSFRILMQATPKGFSTEKFSSEIEALPAVCHISALRVWSIDGEQHVMTLRLCYKPDLCTQLSDLSALTAFIRTIAKRYGIVESTIEVEAV